MFEDFFLQKQDASNSTLSINNPKGEFSVMWFIIEGIVVLLICLLIIWEIIIPGIKGTPLFPIFNRGRTKRLEEERASLRAEIEDGKLSQENERLRKEVAALKGEPVVGGTDQPEGEGKPQEQPAEQ